jgi:hypothetical protein
MIEPNRGELTISSTVGARAFAQKEASDSGPLAQATAGKGVRPQT